MYWIILLTRRELHFFLITFPSNLSSSASRMDHSQNDCILFVILSHGVSGSFCTHDSAYKLDDLFNAFTAGECPTLAGKPKLFIIQTCRTEDASNEGIDKGIIFGAKNAPVRPRAIGDLIDSGDEIRMNYSLPSQRDFLAAYSTSPGQ